MPERVEHKVHGRMVVAHSLDDLLPAIAEDEAVTAGQIIVADAADSLDAVDMTGDLTISSAGVTTIGAGKITVGMIDATLLRFILSVARVDYAHVDYSKVG